MVSRILSTRIAAALVTAFTILTAFGGLTPAQARTAEEFLAANYPQVDPESEIDPLALGRALAYYRRNKQNFNNHRYIGVVDFTISSMEPRFFIVDVKNGDVDAYAVAHGKGSDPGHSNNARRFSDRNGSKASSVGFYRTAETYVGKHGLSMRLDGLSPSNSHARSRDIVVHAADYVTSTSAVGRSNGCFAVSQRVRGIILKKLGPGALLYAYGGRE
jgi:hypothetical protein